MLRVIIKKFFTIFGDNKSVYVKYLFLSLFVGLLELFGVALTYPFVLRLLNKNELDKSSIFLGIGIISLFIFKNAFMILYTYLQANFAKSIEKELNLRFMEFFLSTSYQNSSQIPIAQKGNILNFMIPNFVNNFILRLMNLNVNLFIFILISIFLVFKFPLASIITVFFSLLIILVQNCLFKNVLSNFSKRINQSSIAYTQKTNEIILNLKNIKISSNEIFFYNHYKKALEKFFKISTYIQILNTIPPYVTEPCIIIVLFILLAVISIQNASNTNTLIASFAVIVTAIFRLAPTISRIQSNINGINSTINVINEFLDTYKDFNLENLDSIKPVDYKEFNSTIELRNVSFEYISEKTILKNINLKINRGDFIGIVGLSGAGKTTLIDIITGILKPSSGDILVDGECLKGHLKIGYIPQDFCNINGSFLENVVLGTEDIDETKVLDSLKKSQLLDFINKNFTDGIYANPFIDNVGISIGQKQRLAIARALYSNPDILVLDEATSSLDLKTEKDFCNVLSEIKKEKTIIAVAHKLSTIKNADKIVFLADGKISDIGSFEELIIRNKDFNNFVKLNQINH